MLDEWATGEERVWSENWVQKKKRWRERTSGFDSQKSLITGTTPDTEDGSAVTHRHIRAWVTRTTTAGSSPGWKPGSLQLSLFFWLHRVEEFLTLGRTSFHFILQSTTFYLDLWVLLESKVCQPRCEWEGKQWLHCSKAGLKYLQLPMQCSRSVRASKDHVWVGGERNIPSARKP